jgi:hypothetical protein
MGSEHVKEGGSRAIVTPLVGSQLIVSLRLASFGYGDRAVVSDVTMDIHAGDPRR